MRVAALVAITCFVVLTDAAPAAGADALTWRVAGPPLRLVISRGSTVVAEHARGLVASPGAPFTYRLADGSLHRLVAARAQRRTAAGTVYTVSTDERGRTATVDVRRTARGLRIAWSLQPAGGVVEVYESFTASAGEHFLGTGQREHYVDLRGQIVQLKTSYTCASSAIVPFYLSSRGYGVYFDTTAPGHAQFAGHHDGEQCQPGDRGEVALCRLASAPDRVQACFRASRLAYEVYAGRPLEIVRDFSARAGRPSLPPPSQFALIKWRDSVDGPEDLLEDVDRLQRLGIPLGWILLDNPWEVGGCLGTLEFDPRFPNPKATIAAVRRRGVRFMLWISPYASREEGCPFAAGYPVDAIVEGPPNATIDFTDPRALALFQRRLRALVALGVEGVKADRADELDLEDDAFDGGPGTALHNRYPILFARAVTQVLRERGRDFATIFRAGFTGSARVHHGMWGGDQLGTFEGLRSAIRSAQTAGVSGFPIWGSDIGGYHRGFRGEAPPLTAEVFVRWAQFAAVTPVFEVGGAGRNARFWELGPRAVDHFRRAAILHYELFPYLYDAARRAARAGDPILRPVAFDHPADERAWKADLELLVGSDLLVAPATSQGAVRVYLPPGEWVDASRGNRVRGPRTFLRETPLDELPLYIRAGAAISFNARLPIWRAPWGLNDLERKGRAGWLYAPSGRSVPVRLRGAPREAQVLVLTRRPPRRVTIGGRVVPGSTLAALRRAREGWAFRRGAFGGVVIKLAPRAGRADAFVELP
jgi:alpha-D-xyloside xylohydrolase